MAEKAMVRPVRYAQSRRGQEYPSGKAAKVG